VIEGVKIHDQFIHKDHRGFLLRLVRKEHVGDRIFGDSYILSSIPGVVRGNHFHKRTTEWFCLIKGKGCLGLKKGEQVDFINLDDKNFKLIEIPPGISHAIKNTGDEIMIFFAYADERFNPDDDDIHSEIINFD